MVFIETSAFTKRVIEFLTDDEFMGLQMFLLNRPDAGRIVRGSGGVRKLRWAMAGKGKSGGARVIYYWRASEDEIWLLTIYSKRASQPTSSKELRRKSNVTERNIGIEILEGIREINAFKRGEIQGLRTRELKDPASPEEIRRRLKLSQAAFAGLMGVSVRTIQ